MVKISLNRLKKGRNALKLSSTLFTKSGDKTSESVNFLEAINPFFLSKFTSGCSLSKPLGAVFNSDKLSNFPPKYFL